MPEHIKATFKAIELGQSFGYLYDHEIMALQVLARSLPDGAVFVNVGAGTGTSSLSVYEGNHNLVMYTVDISTGGPLGGLENERNAFTNVGWANKTPIQYLGDSPKVADTFANNVIDFIFIDDGHLEDEITADIEHWLPKVKSGGYVAFHDYVDGPSYWPAVLKVVNELMKNHQFLFLVDTLRVYRKI
jgi:predicted O-methyltransferase YrrM